MAGEQLVRLTLDGQKPTVADILLRGQGRVRAVAQGRDGFIYVAIDDSQGKPTPIIRLEPIARR